MMFKTHLASSLLVSLLSVRHLDPDNKILFISILMIFSIFPDIDSHRSKISRKLGFLRHMIKLFFRHRHFVHSLFIPLAVLITLLLAGKPYLGIAAILGYSSHLILDSLNRQGVMPFYPISKKKIRGIFMTGRLVDCSLFFVFLAASLIIFLS